MEMLRSKVTRLEAWREAEDRHDKVVAEDLCRIQAALGYDYQKPKIGLRLLGYWKEPKISLHETVQALLDYLGLEVRPSETQPPRLVAKETDEPPTPAA